MYFSTAVALLSVPLVILGRCNCLISIKLFSDPLSPLKNPAFSLKMYIFPKQTAAHIVDEQSVPTWLLSTYCKTRKWRVAPFLCHIQIVPFTYCKQYSILFFSLHLHCDHHWYLSKINASVNHTKGAGKLYLVHKTIVLTIFQKAWL